MTTETNNTPSAPLIFKGDLSAEAAADIRAKGSVAIDTETLGLDLNRDRLCLVQMATEDGVTYFVQMPRKEAAEANGANSAPNLAAILADTNVLKLFHFGRFDIAMMERHIGVAASPVYCTKIASKLARTYTDRHGLKEICRELLSVELSKYQQSSDWGAEVLSNDQITYAANDVIYLHRLRAKLDVMLAREGRTELAQKCFDFLPTRAALDLAGWPDTDIFAHM